LPLLRGAIRIEAVVQIYAYERVFAAEYEPEPRVTLSIPAPGITRFFQPSPIERVSRAGLTALDRVRDLCFPPVRSLATPENPLIAFGEIVWNDKVER